MGSAEHERAPGQHGGQQRLAATTIDHASLSLGRTIGRRLQATAGGVTREQKCAASRVQSQIMRWTPSFTVSRIENFDAVAHFRWWKEMHREYFIQAVEAHEQN
jgi:hypothetical protein